MSHTYSFRRWVLIRSLLAVLTGVFSAIAGSTLLAGEGANPNWKFIAGFVGLAAALLTAVDRALGPGLRESSHRSASQLWRELAVEYFSLGSSPPPDFPEARSRLKELDKRRARAEGSSEPAEDWAEEKATARYEEVMARKREADQREVSRGDSGA